MAETCGGCAVIGQGSMFAPTSNRTVIDDLKDAYEKRQMVRQEMRRQELAAKSKNGELSPMEQIEYAGLTAQDALEKLAKLQSRTICYSC